MKCWYCETDAEFKITRFDMRVWVCSVHLKRAILMVTDRYKNDSVLVTRLVGR